MGHMYSNLLIHSLFGTKRCLPVLDSELKAELLPYMPGIVKRLCGRVGVLSPLEGAHEVRARLPFPRLPPACRQAVG
jgi:hypothetical protein